MQELRPVEKLYCVNVLQFRALTRYWVRASWRVIAAYIHHLQSSHSNLLIEKLDIRLGNNSTYSNCFSCPCKLCCAYPAASGIMLSCCLSWCLTRANRASHAGYTVHSFANRRASPFPCRNGVVHRAGRSIIQMLLWGHQMTVAIFSCLVVLALCFTEMKQLKCHLKLC